MPRVSDQEILESYDRMGMLLDEFDDESIRTMFLDEDEAPQGLHQQGYSAREAFHDTRQDDFEQDQMKRADLEDAKEDN